MKRGPKPNPAQAERNERMAAMYRQGLTLEKIGEHFGITRERVRQILAKAGLTRAEGGTSLVARSKKVAKLARLDAECLARWGMRHEDLKQLRAIGAAAAYQHQRASAAQRGIKFTLTLPQWWAVWEASGKFADRGRGIGKYVMSRIKDSGGYEMGNVHIQSAVENSREASKQWAGKQKKHRGVHCLYPGTPRPYIVKLQQKMIGGRRFATAEEAADFRANYIAEHGIRLKSVAGTGRGWTYIAACTQRPYMAQACGKNLGYFATAEEAEAVYRAFIESRQLAQAAQSGVVSADPIRFDSLNSHGAQFCAGEPLNATQLIGAQL